MQSLRHSCANNQCFQLVEVKHTISGNIDVIRLLLEYDPDPFIKSQEDKSALDYCSNDDCKILLGKYIWDKLHQRDRDTALRYSRSNPLSKDVWERILLNKRQQQLCQRLSSPKNKSVLFAFAEEFGMPIDRNMTKAKLCGIISRYLIYGKAGDKSNQISKKLTEDKRQILTIAQKFGININKPLKEILQDLTLIF